MHKNWMGLVSVLLVAHCGTLQAMEKSKNVVQLIEAIKAGNEAKIKDSLKDANVLESDTEGTSMLHWAVKSRNANVVRLLLDKIKEKHGREGVAKSLVFTSPLLSDTFEYKKPETFRILDYNPKFESATLCNDAIIELYKFSTEESRRSTFTDIVVAIGSETVECWSPDRKKICTGTRVARIWNLEDKKVIYSFDLKGFELNPLYLSTDGSRLCHSSEPELWKRLARKYHYTFNVEPSDRSEPTLLSPDKKMLCTVNWRAKIWDVQQVKVISEIELPRSMGFILWSPDGSKIFNDFFEGFAVMNIVGGIFVRLNVSSGWYRNHNRKRPLDRWSPDSHKICVQFNDNILEILNAQTREKIFRLEHRDWVVAVAWSPDSSKIITTSGDGISHLWDATEGKIIVKFEHNGAHLRSGYRNFDLISWNRDGSMICSRDSSNSVQVWDLAKKGAIARIEHKDSVQAIAWSPDGGKVCIGSCDGVVQIWDSAQNRIIAQLQNQDEVVRILWSSDGKKICTRTDGKEAPFLKKAQLWNLAEMKIVAVVPLGNAYNELAWSQDAKEIRGLDLDRTISIWQIFATPLDWAVRLACKEGGLGVIELLMDYEGGESLKGLCDNELIDYVIKKIPVTGHAIEVLEVLIKKCRTLEGLCSKRALHTLQEVHERIEKTNKQAYEKIGALFIPFMEKGSGWLEI